MLAKCTNPGCSHVFRYFGAGKLFRLKRKRGQMEHFWLCPDCAPLMTIAVEPDGKPVVIPRALVSAYRDDGGRISCLHEISPELLMNTEPILQTQQP